MEPLPLGKIIATPGCLRVLQENGVHPSSLLNRHENGDWGNLIPADLDANRDALKYGWRIVSNYVLPDQSEVYVITEADRSSTCIMMPDEY
jgi:hypothetical protein